MRLAAAFSSNQYQRGRVSSNSTTKYSGTPLVTASTRRAFRSKLKSAASTTPSSVVLRRASLISISSARAMTAREASAHTTSRFLRKAMPRMAPRRGCRSGRLLEQREKESVVLGAGQPLCGSAVGKGCAAHPRRARGEGIDHRAVLLREHRTGDIQQFTTRGEHTPKRVEDARLALGECGCVAGTAQPFDVRMTPRDTSGGARHIRENAIE